MIAIDPAYPDTSSELYKWLRNTSGSKWSDVIVLASDRAKGWVSFEEDNGARKTVVTWWAADGMEIIKIEVHKWSHIGFMDKARELVLNLYEEKP